MSCKKYRILMSAVLDEEATEQERNILNEHIAHCFSCAKEFDELKKAKKFASLKTAEEAPDFFETRVLQRIKDRQKVRRPAYIKKMVPVGVALLLLLAGVVYKTNIFQTSGSGNDTNLFVNDKAEQNFDEALLDLYFG